MAKNMNGMSIDELPGDLIKEELQRIVKHRLGSEDYEICIEPASKKGQNFMGEVYRILYKKNKTNDEPTSLILKIAPRNQTSAGNGKFRNIFLCEVLMYDQVFPFFNDIQKSKGIDPKVDGFYECPKYYSSISEELSESLFLEDLKLGQFEVIDVREEPLTFEHVSLLMKALGKFHAMSFVMKDQHPEKFNQFKVQVTEQYWTQLNVYQEYFEHMKGRYITLCEEEKRFDLSAKLKQVIGDDPKAMVFDMVSGAAAEPYAVICHGDATTNNSMFRKDEQGKAVGIQLLDWQFCRYASPVTELVMYLLGSTTKELRDLHYDEFLKIYHESLSNLLSRMGSDPQKLFPYEALLDQFQRFGAYGVFVGILLMPVIYADRDSSPGANEAITDKSQIFLIPEKFKKTYNQLVVDLLDDMIRFGYI